MILSKDVELLACEGKLAVAQAQAVAGQTSKSWDKNSLSVQIQLLEIDQTNEPLRLYTWPDRLSAIDPCGQPQPFISYMCRQVDQIAARLDRSEEYGTGARN